MPDTRTIVTETLRLLALTSKLDRSEFLDLVTKQEEAPGFERFANAVEALTEARSDG